MTSFFSGPVLALDSNTRYVRFDAADKEEVPAGNNSDMDASYAHQAEAGEARSRGDHAEAVRLLTQAMSEGAPTTSLLATRADSLLHLGRPSAAIADSTAALSINPDSTKALRARGIARGVVGDWVAAKTDLSAAQRIDFSPELEASLRFAAEKAAVLEREELDRRAAEEAARKAKEAEIAARKAAESERLRKERALSDLGSQTLTKSGKKSTAEALGKATLIGIYFSAHWCPPCRQFTPMLADLYEKIREDEEELTGGKSQVLEIVFVSSDHDKHGFDEYYKSMPWMAVPFEDQATKANLAQKFDVSGIPAFFVLNAATGAVVDTDARSTVMRSRGDARTALKAWKVI